MYRALNRLIENLRGMQFVTPDELAGMIEAGAEPTCVHDEPEFVVLSVRHPEKGPIYTVSSTAGANMVLLS
jgi:hypothetical protein